MTEFERLHKRTTRHRPIAERFWEKVQAGMPDACWPWLGTKSKGGYGWLRLERSSQGQTSNRIAWTLVNGEIPAGQCVLHRCDNPPCCNPAHLFLGSNLTNVQDKVTKQRQARGEKNGRAILCASQVRDIRLARDGGEDAEALAQRYGVTSRQVQMIGRRTTWRWLSEEA